METVKGDETGREGDRVRTETQGEEREQKRETNAESNDPEP